MLDATKLQQLSKLKVLGKKLFHSGASGDYQSFVKGEGLDFLQLREYVEGDDVRFIDWNASAKTGALLIKDTLPEKDRAVVIVLDCSASNQYSSGKKLKSDLALELTFALSWLAGFNKDKVGLLAYGDNQQFYLPCSKNKNQFLSIFNLAVEKMGNYTNSDVAKTLQALLNIKLRKSLIFFISDFIAEDFFASDKYWLALRKKHFLVPIFLRDVLENGFFHENGVVLDCQDVETGEVHAFEQSFLMNDFLQDFFVSRENFFRSKQLTPLVVRPQDDLFTALHTFFSRRINA